MENHAEPNSTTVPTTVPHGSPEGIEAKGFRGDSLVLWTEAVFRACFHIAGGATVLSLAATVVMLIFGWGDPNRFVEALGTLLDSGGGFALPGLGIGYFAYRVFRDGLFRRTVRPAPLPQEITHN